MVGVSASGNKAPVSLEGIRNNTKANWWNDPGLRRLNTYVMLIFLTSASVGYDGSLIGGLQAIPRWYTDLRNPDTQMMSLMIASQAMGSVAGLPLASWLPDRFGRKSSIFVGNFIIIAGALGQTFVHSAGPYIATRLVVGFGVVLATSSAPSLATELSHPRMFGRVASYYNVCFYAGSIIASWTAFGTLRLASSWSWRLPTIFQAIPAIIQIFGLIKCPESPRYLIARGRHEEAKQILLRYHANGAEQDDLVDFEISQIANQSRQDEGPKASGETGWNVFVRTAGMRRRLFLIIIVSYFSQWAGNGIISYYFAPILKTVGITDPNAQSGLYGGVSVWNALWAIGGASQVDRVGRRALWLIATAGMLASYIVVTALSAVYSKTESAGAGYGVIVMLFVFFAFYDIALTPLAIGYPVEILPYKARAKGMAITYFGIYSAQVFNNYANPLALEAIGYHYYIVYIAILAVMLVVIYFYFPETRGKTLEEIAEVFDRVLIEQISEGSDSPLDTEAKDISEVSHKEYTQIYGAVGTRLSV